MRGWIERLVPLLAVLAAGCGVGDIAVSPSPTPILQTHTEQIKVFGSAVIAVEEQRDSVVVLHQKLTANMMNMSTREVFATTDELAKRQDDLRAKMVRISTPSNEIGAVHAAFSVAYMTELEAYKTLASSVRSGDLTRMQASVSGIMKAEDFYGIAYEQLADLLATVGLDMGDVR